MKLYTKALLARMTPEELKMVKELASATNTSAGRLLVTATLYGRVLSADDMSLIRRQHEQRSMTLMELRKARLDLRRLVTPDPQAALPHDERLAGVFDALATIIRRLNRPWEEPSVK